MNPGQRYWVINWAIYPDRKTYIVDLRSNRKPYSPLLSEAKKWKSLKAVQKYCWLRMDPVAWVIEEHHA